MLAELAKPGIVAVSIIWGVPTGPVEFSTLCPAVRVIAWAGETVVIASLKNCELPLGELAGCVAMETVTVVSLPESAVAA